MKLVDKSDRILILSQEDIRILIASLDYAIEDREEYLRGALLRDSERDTYRERINRMKNIRSDLREWR